MDVMMTRVHLKYLQNLLVIGPIHNKLDKISSLLDKYDLIVVNDGLTSIEDNIINRLSIMDQLQSTGKVIYNVGRIDLTLANKMNIFQPDQLKIAEWVQNKPNVIMVDFNLSFQVIIMSGGIPSHITHHDQLSYNIEASFAIHPHQTYTGGLGYVVCNYPLITVPQFHPHSANIGSIDSEQVHALNINRNGVQDTLLV